jgi:demethylmenaquinone methyltransferase/2-methoxy-6-polyprenyl-1,4-benzoquinol methylase
MFADIAPRYDLLNRVLSLRIDVAWRRAALRALGWDQVPAGRYLDLCAGTLDVGAALVARPGFAGTVAGADFAIPMLRHGTGKAPASRLAPVGADALALPFADAAFDGAIVAFGIRNVARLDDALREVRRTLRPGARFVILEFSTPPNALVRAAYHAYFHRVLPLVGRLVSGHASAYAYLPRSVAHFPAEDALAARLRDAGFRDVHWRRLTLGVAALHVAVA